MLHLGDTFPDFEAETTEGTIKFHEWLKQDKWAILFSHPADFMAVSTTELAMAHRLFDTFKERNVSLIALSCDNITNHKAWIKDILAHAGTNDTNLSFPIIADPNRELAVELGMLGPTNKDIQGIPLTCRVVFIVGQEYKLKLSMLYPASTGINLDEILRVIKSLQLTAYKEVATPVNWKSGGECLILSSVDKDKAGALFPKHRVAALPSGKEYMRFTPQP